MTIALYISASIAAPLAYVAVAGRVYRAMYPRWHGSTDVPWELAVGIWPLVVAWLCVARPVLWCWRLGAASKLPRARVVSK